MNLARLEGDRVLLVKLAPGIDLLEFYEDKKDEGYLLTEVEINPNLTYRLINGEVVLDKEDSDKREYERNKVKCLDFLKMTDFIMLIDNPLNLSSDELNEVIEFRKNLRNVIISDIPKCLERFKK
jgi:hypothetical protein